MKIAVVGATGLVGGVMLQVLEERGFANEEIIVAASAKSVGKKIAFAERELEVVSVESAIESNCDYAIFSAGGSTSKQYAPLFAEKGTIVIDNSSAWRMNEDVPLVVPEINFSAIKPENRIIANPNCSTIQMVLALSNLHKAYGIKRIVVSTYQSVTGTGVKAVRQLECEQQGLDCEKAIRIRYTKIYCLTEVISLKADTLPKNKNLWVKQEKYSIIRTFKSLQQWQEFRSKADTAKA